MSTIGGDGCILQVGQYPVNIATGYEVRIGFFDQPCSFALSLGSGELIRDLVQRFRWNSPFAIYIAGRQQFAGYTDGFDVKSMDNTSELQVRGRDILGRFADSFHERDASYTASTHRDVIEKSLEELDITIPFAGVRPTIASSNAETRYVRSGSPEAADNDEWGTELEKPVGTVGNAVVTLRAKLGERWLDLVLRHLKQDGLFIWSDPYGNLVVGRPNYKQAPCARIVRARGQWPRKSNVKSVRYGVDLKPRYSEVAIYGRTSGKKFARTTASGAYTDDALVNEGVHKVLVIRDADVTSTAAAEAMARRHLSEGRRDGFTLEYEMAGHTVKGVSGETIVWSPDTVVQVDDDELGIHENLWIESVTHSLSNRGAISKLKLLTADALIFSDEVVNEPFFLSDRGKSAQAASQANRKGRQPISIIVNGARVPTDMTINGKPYKPGGK